MSERKDLTRWNRAGLSRFRYVDGNAATFLEELRRTLHRRFSDASGSLQWPELEAFIPPDEEENERLKRLHDQYHDERRDPGWEILRTLARSSHILGGYLDAYANEGYLETATQWENVRRLVAMLDYHPAPPASAATLLVLDAKAGKKGSVATGFQVKNAPEDGSAPLIFETLEDLEIDFELNALRLKDWNLSQVDFAYQACGGAYCAEFPLDAAAEGVSEGSRGILLVSGVGGETGLPVTVTAVSDTALALDGPAPPAGLSLPAKRHQVRLLLLPERIQAPDLLGGDTIALDRDHNLSAGTVVGWQESGTWYAARVAAVDGRTLALQGGEAGHLLPPEDTELYRLNPARKQDVFGTRKVVVPREDDRGADSVFDEELRRIDTADVADSLDGTRGEVSVSAGVALAYYLPKEADFAGIVVARSLSGLIFSGDSGELASGAWIYLEEGSGAPHARRIVAIEEQEDGFGLSFDGPALGTPLRRLYAEFAAEVWPADHNRNLEPAPSVDLDLEILPAALKKGRRLLIEGGDAPQEVKVSAVDSLTGTISVTPPLTGVLSRHALLVRGNVVEAGHGESKPEAILGSGDAARTGQVFVLEKENVAFVADPSLPGGVGAALTVTVGGQRWQQVASLNDSAPAGPHYTVRLTEEGHLEIAFGDGRRGRRLPTGRNNVRASYRVGTGTAGNLTAGSLSEPVKPHPLVEAVSQPLSASGGNAMEGVESLRENAPASLLTLERAVSLADFTHLAAGHSSVWQALAFARPPAFGRHESVKVVVVPAGGGELGQLEQTLATYLEERALPGVAVTICPYQPVLLNLNLTLRVKTAIFDPDQVAAETVAALAGEFSLQRAKLGAPLYRSGISAVVEAVEGVENAVCDIDEASLFAADGAVVPVRHVARGADGTIRSIRPTPEQIIYLDDQAPAIAVEVQEFSL